MQSSISLLLQFKKATEWTMALTEKKQQVIAMVAPAIFAQYSESPGKVFAAIKAIGFSDVAEVTRGAEKQQGMKPKT
jgi:hypothetical protein